MSTDLLMINSGENAWIEVYDDCLVMMHRDHFLLRQQAYKIEKEQVNWIYKAAKKYGWFEKNKTWSDASFYELKEGHEYISDEDDGYYDYYECINIKSYEFCFDFADIYPDYIVIGNLEAGGDEIYYTWSVPKFREIVKIAKEVGLIED